MSVESPVARSVRFADQETPLGRVIACACPLMIYRKNVSTITRRLHVFDWTFTSGVYGRA